MPAEASGRAVCPSHLAFSVPLPACSVSLCRRGPHGLTRTPSSPPPSSSRLQVPPSVEVNNPTTVEISYSNPLPEPVDDCVLLVTLMGQAVKIK